jgi:hypothetical protein
MKINQLYSSISDISIESYLQKCGVDDIESYLKGNSIEPTTNYDNIDEWCHTLNKYMKEGGSNINQE